MADDGIKRIGAYMPSQEQLAARFKLSMPSVSLFGNNWDALKDERCPLCERKLQRLQKTGAFICKSKKHAKPFLLSAQKYGELVKTLK